MKRLLIYSGGMDSTVALHTIEGIELAVSFDYGSRHNAQEIKFAKANCEKLGIPHKVISLKDVFKHTKSALLGDEDVPHGHYEDSSMRSTVVPFRNGVMLSVATAIAESNGLKQVVIASHKGDNAVYPDCRAEFNVPMCTAMLRGTYNEVRLYAPFAFMTKHEIAIWGKSQGVDLENSYSCYEGGEQHCGKCGTCVERAEALKAAEEFDYTQWVMKPDKEAACVNM